MRKALILATASIALLATPAAAQSTTSTRDRIGQVLGNLLGLGNTDDSSVDTQWRAGRPALANQRTQFDARVDSDVRANTMTQATGTRIKADYAALVDLEARYASDRSFSTTERSDLAVRYNTLLQVLSDGRYADTVAAPTADIGLGRVEFNRRVDAQIAARRISRSVGTRLKSDYTALIAVEAGYLRDGIVTEQERADLDARLDALDVRVGDIAYTAPVTARTRLDAIARALPSAGLTTAARAQLLVEHGDLVRLEAAYARTAPTADEQAYLARRLNELEARAKVTR